MKKVYGILSAQLTFTALFTLLVMNIGSSTQKAIFMNPALCVIVLVTYFTTFCALICCRLDRKVPINYILLLVFTACVSFIVGSVCIRYNQVLVFEAAALTAAVVVGVTIYAFTTKTDYTMCGPIVFVISMIILTGFLLAIFLSPWTGYKTMNLIWCCLGAFLFSFYLLCDTQMILGGKHKRQFEEDDYILAALILYLDIINMFLYILEALGNN